MDILSQIKRYQIQLSLLLICLASLTLFYPSLNYYFFQDDWLHFNISRAENVNDILNFFKFRQDIIGWRPIPKQVFFFLLQTIFRSNPFLAHIIIFTFFAGTILLVNSFTKLVLKNPTAGFFAAFLYSTAAFHFVSISWVSAGENIIGTFFFILSAYLFMLFIYKKKLTYYISSFISFLMSLASTEFAVTWPLFILFAVYISGRPKKFERFLKIFKYILPTLILIIIYLVLRLFVFQLPAKTDYQILINIKALNTLLWYFLWLLNLPEVLKYNFLFSSFSFSKDLTFMNPFSLYLKPITLFFSLTVFSLLILSVNNFRKNLSLAFITLLAFTISLFPVLFLPFHTFPYYLSIPSLTVIISFSLLAANSLSKSKLYLFATIIFVSSWFLTSHLTLSFTKRTHWVTGEENISRQVVKLAKSKHPALPRDSTILLYPSTEMIKQALMDQNAIKAIYDDPTLRTSYVDNTNDIKREEDSIYILKIDPGP